jgi:hypothetical protein
MRRCTHRLAWLGPLCLLLAACGSPIVGAKCRPGFASCDGVCVDVSSDAEHCGSCGNDCGSLACNDGLCGAGARDGAADGLGGAAWARRFSHSAWLLLSVLNCEVFCTAPCPWETRHAPTAPLQSWPLKRARPSQ